MVTYRSGRLEEKRQKRRLTIAIVGTLGIFLFFALFGLKLLVSFSLLIDKFRGSTAITQTSQSLLLPPILDPLPTATNSATFKLTGTGAQGTRVTVYVNEKEQETININDNVFEATLTSLSEGINTISARSTDDKGNISDLSNVITVLIKKTPPILELILPDDNTTITGDVNKVTVSGKTEEYTSISINGRVVVVRSDNTFSYDYPLNDGENKLTVVGTDLAGNTTTVERKVTYQK